MIGMKRNSRIRNTAAVIIVMMLALCAFSWVVFADDTADPTPTGTNEIVMEATSAADLMDMLEEAEYTQTDVTIRLAESDAVYRLTSNAYIPANTTLDLNGQTISRSSEYSVYLDGNKASIINGTLQNGGIRVSSYDAGGRVSGVTINDAPAHGIYVTGTLGEISSCKISSAGVNGIYLNGGSVPKGIKNNKISYSDEMGIRLFSRASTGDITGNTIQRCGYHAIQFNGSSSSSSNDGSSAGDITDNIIKNCKGDGISLYHGSHCGRIANNKLSYIGGHDSRTNGDFGIIINSGCNHESYSGPITHNTVSHVTFAAIVVYSDTRSSRQNNGYIKGDISYNVVNYSSKAKKGINWNKKTNMACEAAIYVDSRAKVKGDIHHNKVNTSYDNGICVLKNSSVNNIYKNTVKNTGNAGISVTSNSKVLGAIKENTISSSKRYGIFINNASKVAGKIIGNKISGIKQNGIFVVQKSSAGTITKNTIKNAKLYGVIAAAKGKIRTLSDNTIAVNNASKGIGVISNTGCLISNISGNSISGKYNSGIRVKSPTGRVKVLKNKLKAGNPSSKKSTGISIDGCKGKVITVKSNKIVGNNTSAGIYIKNSAGVVKKNRISRSKGKVSVVKGSYKVRQ